MFILSSGMYLTSVLNLCSTKHIIGFNSYGFIDFICVCIYKNTCIDTAILIYYTQYNMYVQPYVYTYIHTRIRMQPSILSVFALFCIYKICIYKRILTLASCVILAAYHSFSNLHTSLEFSFCSVGEQLKTSV